MKTLVRILSIAGLGLGFAVAANAASVRFDTSLQGEVMGGCKKCDKDKKEGEGKEAPKPQSLWAGAFSADVMHCGSCGKKKECPKDGDKKDCPKDGDKKTSTMSNLGECNKDKKECPKDKDKDKQTADNDKKEGECPSGGCGKKKQS